MDTKLKPSIRACPAYEVASEYAILGVDLVREAQSKRRNERREENQRVTRVRTACPEQLKREVEAAEF